MDVKPRCTVLSFFLCAVALSPLAQAQSYEDLFRRALSSAACRQYAGAIEKYKAALKLRPGAPEAISNLDRKSTRLNSSH